MVVIVASLVAVFLIAFVVAAAFAAADVVLPVVAVVVAVAVLSVAGAYFSVVVAIAAATKFPYLVAIRVDSGLTDSRTGHHSNY